MNAPVDPLPPLPATVRGTPRAFVSYCRAELERRRSRDVALDSERFGAAARLVLSRLGVKVDS